MSSSRPKGCEQCQENCTIHLTQIVGNQEVKVGMCASCPYAQKIEEQHDFGLIDELLGKAVEQEQAVIRTPNLICPGCGVTDCDLQKDLRFGCSQCYETFQELLNESLLPKLCHEPWHPGKIPNRFREASAQRRISALELILKHAVEREYYEAAAKIRDKITALKTH